MMDRLVPHMGSGIASPACHCLEQLRYHASRLDALLRILANPVCLVGPPAARGFQAVDLFEDIRVALRRDYEAGDGPKLTKVQLLTQYALHRAFTELRPGGVLNGQMLCSVQKARRVLAGTLTELRDPGPASRSSAGEPQSL